MVHADHLGYIPCCGAFVLREKEWGIHEAKSGDNHIRRQIAFTSLVYEVVRVH